MNGRVKVTGSLTYNGRVGTVVRTEDHGESVLVDLGDARIWFPADWLKQL